jgi:peroxiredoxin Q/BCP
MPTTRSDKKGSTYSLRKREPKSDNSADEDYGAPARKKKKVSRKKSAEAETEAVTNDLLRIGEAAPNFENVSDEKDQKHSLADFKGKKLVLFFYPKDNTPGCTTECVSFRDHYETFQKHNVQVVGVSADTVKSHESFKSKKNLPFMLLSDVDLSVIKSYGVKGKGKGARRVTVVIDENGKIERVYVKVNPKKHVTQVLNDLGIKTEEKEENSEAEKKEE